MSMVRRQLWALAVALAALYGIAQAQSQSSGGMVSGGNPGPGFMGAGSGSSGTVDGGMLGGPRDTSPGESRKRVTRQEARISAGHLVGPTVSASVPVVTGTGLDGAPQTGSSDSGSSSGASTPNRAAETAPAPGAQRR